MGFFNFAIDNPKEDWSLYLIIIFLLLLLFRLGDTLKNWFFSFITIFTIPATISFVALLIVIIHFYQNSLRADDTVVKLLVLIVTNHHLPNILLFLSDAVSRIKDLRVGSFEAKFEAIGTTADALRLEQDLPRTTEQLFGERTVGNLTNYLYTLFGGLKSKMDSVFRILFSEEAVPANTYSIVIRLQEAGHLDAQTAVVLNTLINLSDLLSLGYKPTSIEINNAIDYCLYVLDYLDRKEKELTVSPRN